MKTFSLPSLPPGPLGRVKPNFIFLDPGIEQAAARVRILHYWKGKETELVRVPVWSGTTGDRIPITLYIWAIDSNPEAVMSVYPRNGKYAFEFGRQTGADIYIYIDGVSRVNLTRETKPGYWWYEA